MYQEEIKQKIRTFLDDYRVRQETIGKVGDVQSLQFDFLEDTVVIKGTDGYIRFSLSFLERLATQAIVH